MPPGAPFDSFLLPYPIRVDAFATPNTAKTFRPPALYLLTHTHSDHVVGLNALSFGGVVVCSETAKEMLLRDESTKDRINYDNGIIHHKKRRFSHLRIEATATQDGKKDQRFTRDLLKAISLNTPTEFELYADLKVRITAIDANHCPGSVMFLVEGPLGSVLHTGDVRAEPWFIQAIARNPVLQHFIPHSKSECIALIGFPLQTLEAIYIDTAMLTALGDLPSKEEATSDLVELMELFDPSTTFYLNTWTWGYEDILKAVARRFNTKIHVDRYKATMYKCSDDPFLKSIITAETETRFHACERLDRCHFVRREGQKAIYINPVDISTTNWEFYKSETTEKLLTGEKVTDLIVPLSRHSGLVELQALVTLFRPKKVVPNFLLPGLGKLDWLCMPAMFESCLTEGGAYRMALDIQKENPDLTTAIQAVGLRIQNIALENVEGEGAKEIAALWSSKEPRYGRDTLLARLEPFLPKTIHEYIEKNYHRLLLEGEIMRDKEEGGSSDDEADAHSQDWRVHWVPVKRAPGIPVDWDGAIDDKRVRGPRERLLLTDTKEALKNYGKSPQKLTGAKIPARGKRKRDTGDLSLPPRKKRPKSPEVIVIDSSPSPVPASRLPKVKETTILEFPEGSLTRSQTPASRNTELGRSSTTPYREKARELKSRMVLAKRHSSVDSESVASVAAATGKESRLAVAWSQTSLKLLVPSSSREATFASKPSEMNAARSNGSQIGAAPEGTGSVHTQSAGHTANTGLPAAIDLDHAKALLNQLTADKGHWLGLSCVGSQSQSQ